MKYLKLFEEVNVKTFNIPDDVIKLSNIFNDSGYDLFIVGGAVRDFLMGKKPKDYDLVTNAHPNDIQRILNDKYRLDLQGKHFAVIRVYTEETPLGIEIASYRKDISKGRDNKYNLDKPKVEYGNHISIRDDVKRRDLTINALYYDINKEKIVDLVGGINDINNKIIRSVGNPKDRFNEDRLRILRCLRFAARTNSNIDDDTSNAIINDNRLNGISLEDDVSQERIIDEFYSMLKWSIKNNNIDSWKRYFNLLKYYKLFDKMFPGLLLNLKYYNTLNDKLIFSLMFIHNKPNKELYDKLVFDLKLTSSISNSVIFLIKIKDLLNDNNISKVLDYENKTDNIVNLFKHKQNIDISDIVIKRFSILSNLDLKYINGFIKYRPTVNISELMKKGYSGKKLGDAFKKLEIDNFINILDMNNLN